MRLISLDLLILDKLLAVQFDAYSASTRGVTDLVFFEFDLRKLDKILAVAPVQILVGRLSPEGHLLLDLPHSEIFLDPSYSLLHS